MNSSRPQAREMAVESMVRNLAAQAEAIWPQEEPIFARHDPGDGTVLDVGCGTGEITGRLAERFPRASFVGIDLDEAHREKARARCARFGSRVRFQSGDALELPFSDSSFTTLVNEGDPEPTDITVARNGNLYWTCTAANVIVEARRLGKR